MATGANIQEVPAEVVVPVKLVDADVHPYFRRVEEIVAHLPKRWRHRSPRNLKRTGYYEVPNGGGRWDASPPGGDIFGSDPQMFERQLLQQAGVDYAIHLDLLFGTSPDADYDAALRSAINDWMAETWLGTYNRHGRYRGSIALPINNPNAAVREIERWAGDRRFVQVRVPDTNAVPFGNPIYHPIWEAASRHGLPVALHAQYGGTALLSSPVGFFRYYVEWHSVGIPLAYMTHLSSLICEGVFDRYPDLKVVFVEGGFSWLAPFLWRMEKNWGALRGELPECRRRPTDYIYDHVRFTSQPVEEPEPRRNLRRLFDMIDADRILMFATDYPHWDYDDPAHALPKLTESAHARIFCENARDLYKLPATRPV